MGCDIHSFAEVYDGQRWNMVGDVFPLDKFWREWHKKTHGCHPFDERNYGMFGLLADVRNYSHVPVIAEPKHSLPDDVSDGVKAEYGDDGDWHTTTYLTLRQLLDFDYDQVFWDRRVTKQTTPNSWDGAALAEEGEGRHLTVREFVGQHFFHDLEILQTLGSWDTVRVVFWFDN
ncbi:MAG: hypothetical protein WAK20_06635 [Candidatus Acidiferrum sp.]